MENLKEKILKTIPIESYISKFVSLKKQGKNYVGLCPFHKEKTPSFTVSPSRGLFYCFGCGKGGNLITFVMEKEQVNFKEAIEILARYAGIPLSTNQSQKYAHLYEILDLINEEYRKFLKSEEGKLYYDYIVSRGVKPEMILQFQIGAVGDSFISEKYFQNREELVNIGLIKKKDNFYYDFFRKRLIFPIHNLEGKIVGFGGRAIDDTKPKYLNSPESYIFHKGSLLYGFYHGIQEIKKTEEVWITEGYLDVIGMHQMGITNVVAPLGTSFTEEHKKILKRYVKNFYLIMDGDRAGRNSALRILLLFYDMINKLKIIFLPEGKDAFDLSREFAEGKYSYSFMDLKKQFINGIEYILFTTIYIDEMDSLFQIQDVLELNQFLHGQFEIPKLSDYFRNLSIEKKQIVIQKVEELIRTIKDDIFSEILIQEFEKILKLKLKKEEFSSYFQIDDKKNKKKIADSEDLLFLLEREILGLIFLNPQMIYKYYKRINQIPFFYESLSLVWNILYDKFLIVNQEKNISEIFSMLPENFQEIFANYIMKNESFISENDYDIIMEELLAKHRIEEINFMIQQKRKEMSVMEEEAKTFLFSEINKLIKEKQLLISTLKGSL